MNNCTMKKTKNGLKVVTFKSGYQVSIKDLVKISCDVGLLSFERFHDIIKDYVSIMEGEKNLYIGVWYNPDDGLTYIDISIHIMSRKKALYIGRLHNQLCIYDWRFDECLPCNN